MQDRPLANSTRKPPAVVARQLLRWAAKRHRTAISLMLRGACYGTGTAAISLITLWVQNHW